MRKLTSPLALGFEADVRTCPAECKAPVPRSEPVMKTAPHNDPVFEAAANPIAHRRAAFLLVLATVLATRVPFLSAGFGTDPDAWLVAVTARRIAATGQYVASRPPGYPVHELVTALVIHGGPIALTGLTAMFSVAAVGFFMSILRRLGCAAYPLAGLALAMTPVVFIGSTNALDYVWALALLLAAYYFALLHRPLAAGILLGLATGCRLTSALMLAPLAVALYDTRSRRSAVRPILRLAAAWVITSAAAYLPVALTCGTDVFRFHEPSDYPSLEIVLSRATLRTWGAVGLIAIATAVIHRILRGRAPRGKPPPPETHGPPLKPSAESGAAPHRHTWAALLAVLLYGLAFLRLPLEEGYLIPATPFALVLLWRLLSHRAFSIGCACLCASPWFFYLGRPAGTPWSGYSGLAVRVGPGEGSLLIDPLRGPILRDRVERREAMRYVDRVLNRAAALPERSVTIVGYWLPHIRFKLGDDDSRLERFEYLLDRAELDRLKTDQRRVFYLPDMRAFTLAVHGFDLRDAGAEALEIDID